jgi:hypothetical protein
MERASEAEAQVADLERQLRQLQRTFTKQQEMAENAKKEKEKEKGTEERDGKTEEEKQEQERMGVILSQHLHDLDVAHEANNQLQDTVDTLQQTLQQTQMQQQQVQQQVETAMQQQQSAIDTMTIQLEEARTETQLALDRCGQAESRTADADSKLVLVLYYVITMFPLIIDFFSSRFCVYFQAAQRVEFESQLAAAASASVSTDFNSTAPLPNNFTHEQGQHQHQHQHHAKQQTQQQWTQLALATSGAGFIDTQLADVLTQLQLQHYIGPLVANEVTVALLGTFDDHELKQIGFTTVGARRKVLRFFEGKGKGRRFESGY